VSHIEDKEQGTTELDFMPPAPPVQISTAQSAEDLILMGAPENWEEADIHSAPTAPWVLTYKAKIS